VGDEATRVLQIEDPQQRDREIRRLRDEIADMMNDLVPEIGTESRPAETTQPSETP
jgi:hypothetical protein